MEVAGLILAGGLSRRMGGGDKGLTTVGGHSLLERVVTRLTPQVGPLLLSANGDPARFRSFGLPVAADVVENQAGPLVGILTGLEWFAARHPEIEWMVSAAADTPLLPTDLVERLLAAATATGADIAMPRSGGHAHPVFALWPLRLAAALRRAVVNDGQRGVGAWAGRHRVATVDWPVIPNDPFFNVNTPEDLAELPRILATSPACDG